MINKWNLNNILFRIFYRFSNGIRDSCSLTQANSNVTIFIAHCNQNTPAHGSATLMGLLDFICPYDLLF